MSPEFQLQTIYAKLQKLVKEHEHLKKENKKLEEELVKSERSQTVLAAKEKQLQDQIAILKMTGKPLDEVGKKDLDKRINNYIKNIDKAISLLNE